MQEENKVDTNYQKGFNEGYIITKHLPKLSDSFAEVKSETPRIAGFQDGRKQYVLEQTKDRRPSWLNANHHRDLPKEQSKDRAKGPDKE